mgnify:FL=1
MIRIILILSALLLSGCANYQVIQKIDVDMYHLTSKKGQVAIVLTGKDLQTGKYYRLKSITKKK